MRTLLVAAVVTALASMTQARVWTTVYRCDETTPLAVVDPNQPSMYRDIMVGTRLAIVIQSDSDDYWWGSLQFSTDDDTYLTLNGRGYDERRFSYVDSCLPAAGEQAAAWIWMELGSRGFEFFTDAHPTPGDWFVFDYRARQVGSCTLRLYNFDADPLTSIGAITLTQVPSRDFDGSTMVDLEDFAVLASRWRTTLSPDPNSAENQFDLDSDGLVGIGDLTLFSEYWLERTDCNEPAEDPNRPSNP